LPGQQDKKADKVEVPTSAADLCAWLNVRGVMPNLFSATVTLPILADDDEPQLASDPPPPAPDQGNRCGTCRSVLSTSDKGALVMGDALDTIAIADWADTIGLDRIHLLQAAADTIRNRARELGAEWDERTVQ
jgi:hypothetical protein